MMWPSVAGLAGEPHARNIIGEETYPHLKFGDNGLKR